MDLLRLESISLWTALIGYSLICAILVFGLDLRKRLERMVFAFMTNALPVLATCLIAFFTFFVIPFVSTALHKGMV